MNRLCAIPRIFWALLFFLLIDGFDFALKHVYLSGPPSPAVQVSLSAWTSINAHYSPRFRSYWLSASHGRACIVVESGQNGGILVLDTDGEEVFDTVPWW